MLLVVPGAAADGRLPEAISNVVAIGALAVMIDIVLPLDVRAVAELAVLSATVPGRTAPALAPPPAPAPAPAPDDATRRRVETAVADHPDQPDALVYRAVARRLLAGPGDARVRADLLRFLSLVPDDARRPMAEALLAETPAAPAATPPSSAPSDTRSPSVAP